MQCAATSHARHLSHRAASCSPRCSLAPCQCSAAAARRVNVGRLNLSTSDARFAQLLPTARRTQRHGQLWEQQSGWQQSGRSHADIVDLEPWSDTSLEQQQQQHQLEHPEQAQQGQQQQQREPSGAGTGIHAPTAMQQPQAEHGMQHAEGYGATASAAAHDMQSVGGHDATAAAGAAAGVLVLHRLVLPPNLRSQAPCCAHTCIMVHTSAAWHGGRGAAAGRGMPVLRRGPSRVNGAGSSSSSSSSSSGGSSSGSSSSSSRGRGSSSGGSSSGSSSPGGSNISSITLAAQSRNTTTTITSTTHARVRHSGSLSVLRVEVCGRDCTPGSPRCKLHEGASGFEVWGRERRRAFPAPVSPRWLLLLRQRLGRSDRGERGRLQQGRQQGQQGRQQDQQGRQQGESLGQGLSQRQGERQGESQGQQGRQQGQQGQRGWQQGADLDSTGQRGQQYSSDGSSGNIAGSIRGSGARSGIGRSGVRAGAGVLDPASTAPSEQLPKLLFGCESAAELASYLGVGSVRFVDHWGGVASGPHARLPSLLVRPGLAVQQQDSEGQLVGEDGRAVQQTPWTRSKLYRRTKASNTAGRGLQLHLRQAPSTLQPLQPWLVDWQ